MNNPSIAAVLLPMIQGTCKDNMDSDQYNENTGDRGLMDGRPCEWIFTKNQISTGFRYKYTNQDAHQDKKP